MEVRGSLVHLSDSEMRLSGIESPLGFAACAIAAAQAFSRLDILCGESAALVADDDPHSLPRHAQVIYEQNILNNLGRSLANIGAENVADQVSLFLALEAESDAA